MSAQRKPAAYDNDWLGNMNATMPMAATWDGRFPVTCGCTPLDVARMAAREQIAPGTVISLFNRTLGDMRYRIVAAPHDNRANGLWAERA
jgi:hypothetical protein